MLRRSIARKYCLFTNMHDIYLSCPAAASGRTNRRRRAPKTCCIAPTMGAF
jgi:hypothetical protein